VTERGFLYIVCVMPHCDYLGEFEHIVVLALLRLGDRTYGVTVVARLQTYPRGLCLKWRTPLLYSATMWPFPRSLYL
jgi:hypothetical protein